MKKDEKVVPNKKDRSVIGAVAGTFTIKWLIQTIAAWGFSIWLTKIWNKYVKKEKDDASNNKYTL